MHKLILVVTSLVLFTMTPAMAGLMTVAAKDDQGNPLEAIEVTAINLQTKFQVKRATNRYGVAHLGWIPGGVYRVSAVMGGRATPSRELNVTAAPVQIEFKGAPAVVVKAEAR